MNLPLYRAKKIDSDEWVEGYLLPPTSSDTVILMTSTPIGNGFFNQSHEIDKNTLAIHFQNMIDKNGKKIFASLSEDGVGGDVIQYEDVSGYVKYSNGRFMANTQDGLILEYFFVECEVIGIYK